MNAFNYDTQRWITGKKGAALRAKQIEEDIAILESPDGERFVRMTVKRGQPIPSVADELAAARNALQAARAELHS